MRAQQDADEPVRPSREPSTMPKDTRRVLRLLAYTDAFTWGGAEECLGTLIGQLNGRYSITVAGTNPEVVDRVGARRPDAAVLHLPPVENKFDVPSIAAHVRAFRRVGADVCHINLRTPYSCQGGIVAAALTRSTRIVAVEHLPLHSDSSFMRWSRRRAARLYAAHIAVGDRAARWVEHEIGLPAGVVRTIHNGVTSFASEDVPDLGLSGPVVGTVGRLVSQKGHETLVRALVELPGVTAVIVGEGPRRSFLEQLADRLGVRDRLVLPGWDDRARRYLPLFDVFALPSRFEGFPLSILEAMLAGVPVVASTVGSIAEAVEHEATGLLVPPDDPSALAAALRRLLDDPALAHSYAETARRRAERVFTAEMMAAEYEKVYEEVAR
jgi:glycosyltransferase involved in cell wall biosynthesis